MNLRGYTKGSFSRGRSVSLEALWWVAQEFLFASWLPGSWHRCVLLRTFGARIGLDVVIKPRVRVKFPWRLHVGDYSWIGEGVWIDNLADVSIGSHSVISQEAYLCTGSHDWSREYFDLSTKPISIKDQCWIAAKAVVGPGVTVGQGAVLALGSVATCNLKPGWIYSGNPAKPVRPRYREQWAEPVIAPRATP